MLHAGGQLPTKLPVASLPNNLSATWASGLGSLGQADSGTPHTPYPCSGSLLPGMLGPPADHRLWFLAHSAACQGKSIYLRAAARLLRNPKRWPQTGCTRGEGNVAPRDVHDTPPSTHPAANSEHYSCWYSRLWLDCSQTGPSPYMKGTPAGLFCQSSLAQPQHLPPGPAYFQPT